MEDKLVDYKAYWTTFAIDRRSLIEQKKDKFIVIGMTFRASSGNALVMLKFDEDNKFKDEVILSKESTEV